MHHPHIIVGQERHSLVFQQLLPIIKLCLSLPHSTLF